ncbi:MAG: leucine-rich repeat domain-containing protein [Firmicutes bacterium]|nr:leucine-rich repeat domain-containing protein [Bacillota bacterium]
MTQDTSITVNLIFKIRLKQALINAGVKDPTLITKLTITGNIQSEDFDYICKNMSNTLKILDMSMASIKWNRITSDDFRDCTGLVQIYISDTVSEIEDFPFSSCTALTTINVHPDNPYFSSENGVLFNKKKTELLFYPMGKEGDYEIPASVSKIKRWAFYFCDGLSSIVFPNSLIEIEDNFYGCSNLTSVIIPASVIKIEINDWEGAFLGALSLTAITVSPENPVYASEKGILFNKDKTVLLLCPRAWQGEFTIPISVEKIHEDAFFRCDSLTSINVEPDNLFFASEQGVLFNKDKTVLVCYPEGREGDYVLPNSVVSLGKHAFNGNTKLTSIIISNAVIEIDSHAFSQCYNLKNVSIPNSVTKIGECAFEECEKLTTINLPDSLIEIEDEVFTYTNIETIHIPKSVAKIGNCALGDVTSITVDPDNPAFSSENGVLFNKDKTMLVFYPDCQGNYEIPNSVTEIGDWSFYSCAGLTSVTIPNSVTKIGNSAFRHCIKLSTVSIPQSVIEIGERAFHGCTGLTTLTIANLTVKVGDNAFDECNALEDISWDEVNEFFTVLKEK